MGGRDRRDCERPAREEIGRLCAPPTPVDRTIPRPKRTVTTCLRFNLLARSFRAVAVQSVGDVESMVTSRQVDANCATGSRQMRCDIGHGPAAGLVTVGEQQHVPVRERAPIRMTPGACTSGPSRHGVVGEDLGCGSCAFLAFDDDNGGVRSGEHVRQVVKRSRPRHRPERPFGSHPAHGADDFLAVSSHPPGYDKGAPPVPGVVGPRLRWRICRRFFGPQRGPVGLGCIGGHGHDRRRPAVHIRLCSRRPFTVGQGLEHSRVRAHFPIPSIAASERTASPCDVHDRYAASATGSPPRASSVAKSAQRPVRRLIRNEPGDRS